MLSEKGFPVDRSSLECPDSTQRDHVNMRFPKPQDRFSLKVNARPTTVDAMITESMRFRERSAAILSQPDEQANESDH